MTMKLIKKTAEYSIYKRGDERFAVKDAAKRPVNGGEKVKILLAEGLITVTEAAPAPAPVEEEAVEEAADTADGSTDDSAEEAAAEDDAPEGDADDE